MLELLVNENQKETIRTVFASKPNKSDLVQFLEGEFNEQLNIAVRDFPELQQNNVFKAYAYWLNDEKNGVFCQEYKLDLPTDPDWEHWSDINDWFVANEKRFYSHQNSKEMQLVLGSMYNHIEIYYSGNRSSFARDCGVARSQVNEWLIKGFKIIENAIYSKRRQIPIVTAMTDN